MVLDSLGLGIADLDISRTGGYDVEPYARSSGAVRM